MKKGIKRLKCLFQTNGKILKIVTNPKSGTIKVYDENGKLMMKKTNLSNDQVEAIGDHLIGFITKSLNGTDKSSKKDSFDPMVA